jgi:transcriptional regulator with XRE-family HTH domain
MMTFQELIDWLAKNKGSGRWREVANHCGVDYSTIARIARGHITQPSVVLFERIVKGIRATEPSAAS